MERRNLNHDSHPVMSTRMPRTLPPLGSFFAVPERSSARRRDLLSVASDGPVSSRPLGDFHYPEAMSAAESR